jgi:hypothetical protein
MSNSTSAARPVKAIHTRDGRFMIGHSNEDEGGGFAVLADITDQAPFIVSCVEGEKPISGLNFGDAIAALKAGKRVARAGWNGKGMWLGLVLGYEYNPDKGRATDMALGCLKLPWIGMKTANHEFVPWLASQTGMLAEDWLVLEDRA